MVSSLHVVMRMCPITSTDEGGGVVCIEKEVGQWVVLEATDGS
jgi:hypothetical protein